MKVLIVAVHGILTGQTTASWPDRFDAWMYRRDPEAKVLKKEYLAGPFPRWNCLVKDPRLANGLEAEILAFAQPPAGDPGAEANAETSAAADTASARNPSPTLPPIWFVAHSNGAVIALLTAQRLIARGCWVGGMILTGAACNADVRKNGVAAWLESGALGAAIAYSAASDAVLPGARGEAAERRGLVGRALRWVYSALARPYGALGRTGWMCGRAPATESAALFTRWFDGGHSGYFTPENFERTFERIYEDIASCQTSLALQAADPETHSVPKEGEEHPTKHPADSQPEARGREEI